MNTKQIYWKKKAICVPSVTVGFGYKISFLDFGTETGDKDWKVLKNHNAIFCGRKHHKLYFSSFDKENPETNWVNPSVLDNMKQMNLFSSKPDFSACDLIIPEDCLNDFGNKTAGNHTFFLRYANDIFADGWYETHKVPVVLRNFEDTRTIPLRFADRNFFYTELFNNFEDVYVIQINPAEHKAQTENYQVKDIMITEDEILFADGKIASISVDDVASEKVTICQNVITIHEG